MNEPHAPLRGRLFYLHFGSPTPERLARFYSQIFGMTAHYSAGGWICRGPNRCLVFSTGEPNTLLCAGYAAADAQVLQGLKARAAASLVHPSAVDSELFEPGAIAFHDPDGNRIVYGVPSTSVFAQAADAPPARLQHVVVGSIDVPRMVAFYTTVIGLRESDEVKDEQGVMRTCFLRSDDEHHSFAVVQTPKNRLDHHCYELSDWNGIRDWGDRLAASRIPVKW